MIPKRWLILADDLTGAADCAIAFSRNGLQAAVTWHADGLEEAVVAIDADSRAHGPEAAAAKHRLLIEARNEADTILAAVDRAPSNPAWKLLSSEEQAAIARAKAYLIAVSGAPDPRVIRAATLALDQATRRFAELLMDAAVSTAIRGKTMESAGEELGDAVTAPHPMAAAEFK